MSRRDSATTDAAAGVPGSWPSFMPLMPPCPFLRHVAFQHAVAFLWIIDQYCPERRHLEQLSILVRLDLIFDLLELRCYGLCVQAIR